MLLMLLHGLMLKCFLSICILCPLWVFHGVSQFCYPKTFVFPKDKKILRHDLNDFELTHFFPETLFELL